MPLKRVLKKTIPVNSLKYSQNLESDVFMRLFSNSHFDLSINPKSSNFFLMSITDSTFINFWQEHQVRC